MANTKPTTTVRIASIKAAIWTNETKNGVRHTVTFERLYREGNQWKSTRSFGRNDLLLLAEVVHLAHSRILEFAKEPPAE